MSLLGFLILLLVAGVCGALGQAISGFSRGGCLVSIALGFIGALFGRWLAAQFNLPEPFVIDIEGKPFGVVWSIVGATIFVAIIGLLTSRRGPPLA